MPRMICLTVDKNIIDDVKREFIEIMKDIITDKPNIKIEHGLICVDEEYSDYLGLAIEEVIDI